MRCAETAMPEAREMDETMSSRYRSMFGRPQ
jgi:hypothetical protein